ncbi:hypothetical protein SD78_0984 [Bacillus badius]|nr:hypothetical protein SD78_0984 [Bacillus badius]
MPLHLPAGVKKEGRKSRLSERGKLSADTSHFQFLRVWPAEMR